jgi:hypothetical protein
MISKIITFHLLMGGDYGNCNKIWIVRIFMVLIGSRGKFYYLMGHFRMVLSFLTFLNDIKKFNPNFEDLEIIGTQNLNLILLDCFYLNRFSIYHQQSNHRNHTYIVYCMMPCLVQNENLFIISF